MSKSMSGIAGGHSLTCRQYGTASVMTADTPKYDRKMMKRERPMAMGMVRDGLMASSPTREQQINRIIK